jgi:hypothetical protein
VSFLQTLDHALSFAAPALVVALLVAAFAPFLLPRGGPRLSWWAAAGLNFAAGLAVLAAGLWWFGRDGKMATYALLVLVTATVLWLGGRGWRA